MFVEVLLDIGGGIYYRIWYRLVKLWTVEIPDFLEFSGRGI